MNRMKKLNPLYCAFLLAMVISGKSYGYDLNNDGYDDIVFSNYYNGSSRNTNSYIYWGNGTGSYTAKTELETHGAVGNSVVDLNDDGYMDIVFSNRYNDSSGYINSYIYWGDATASYSTRTNVPTSGSLCNAVGDLNSDGYLDIVFSNHYDGTTALNAYIYWGNATASYTTKSEIPVKGGYAISLCDLNDDNYVDIVFSNSSETSTVTESTICWGDASASYNTTTPLATMSAIGNSVVDLNGDGYMDIIYSNSSNGSTNHVNSYIYWGDATASYNAMTELATVGASGNSVADLNGDGYMDIVFSNTRDGNNWIINSYIYWGDATASYSLKTELSTIGAIGNTIADVNGDGYLDIIFGNYYNGSSWDLNSYIYWGDATASYSSKSELATLGAAGVTAGNMSTFGQNYLPESDDPEAVPEPLSLLLISLSLMGLKIVRRKKT